MLLYFCCQKVILLFFGGEIAQLVEQGTENPRVGGSIPPLTTIYLLKDKDFFAITRIIYYRRVCHALVSVYFFNISFSDTVPIG